MACVTVFDLSGLRSADVRVSLGSCLLNSEIERGDQIPSSCRDRPTAVFSLSLVVVAVTMHRLLEGQNSLRGRWRYHIKILLQTFSSRYIKMTFPWLQLPAVGGSPGARSNCKQGLKVVASAISFGRFFPGSPTNLRSP